MTTYLTQRTSTYTIYWNNQRGATIQSTTRFQDLAYQLAANTPTDLTVIVPESEYPAQLANPAQWLDAQVEVWRGVGSLPEQQEGDTVWFINDVEFFTSAVGVPVVQVSARHALTLCERYSIPFFEDADRAKIVKSGQASTVMREIVSENLTRGITTAFFDVDTDPALGAAVDIDLTNGRVLSALQDIIQQSAARGITLQFDVVRLDPDSPQLIFRIYNPRNRIRNTELSSTNRTLQNARLSYDFSRYVNHVYARGQGEDDLTLNAEATDTSLFATGPYRRREAMVNAHYADTQATTQAEADQALRDQRPLILLEGDVVNSSTFRYGIEWQYGDRLPVEERGQSFEADITSVSVRVQGQRETVQASIRATREL